MAGGRIRGTENIDVVKKDFTGAVFRVVERPCDDEPCPVVLRSVSGSEDALILQGMRFEPEEGGSVYLGTRKTLFDCVEIDTGVLIAEGVYDTTITVRWQGTDEGGGKQLRFVYSEEGTITSPTENCPNDIRLEASFRAERIRTPANA